MAAETGLLFQQDLGVCQRRTPGSQYRGRRVSRDFWHRHDGADHVGDGDALRGRGRGVFARIRQAGGTDAYHPDRGK